MKYHIVANGLKLPTVNRALRMYWRERHEEMKRTRKAVRDAAIYGHGITNPTPLEKAQVEITAFGPYGRRDSDGTLHKWVLDALVAKPIRVGKRTVGREWGVLSDDRRDVVGEVTLKTVLADEYRVEIFVYEV